MPYDRAIEDAVQMVRDRFGAQGLRDLIELAQAQLGQVEAALAAMSGDREGDIGDETKQFFVFFDDDEKRR